MQKHRTMNDLLSKKMLTAKGSEHILKAFVKDCCGMDFQSVTLLEPYDIKSYNKAYKYRTSLDTEIEILGVTQEGEQVMVKLKIPQEFYS
ncbi:hypothetical protein NRIC_09510 [Enterococcus florum]|uniref:Uncharacterized protein n=1 Tax=Enterococcus florum TaxID=2480627 RepID=A0A4P5P5U3_9ENTE|nr:hypothetical protein [Enterococcus florum]GCF93060.1 hypothetical protein NRIC_09510 [Enterococcus florum]